MKKLIGKWVKFKDLQKNDKIFRIINLLLMFAQFVSCIALGIYYIVVGREDRLFASFGIAALVLVPCLAEYIFRHRMSNIIFFSIQFYILFAGFVGCVLDAYNQIWWFDLIVHLLAGYVFALLGIFVISRLDNYKKLNVWLVLAFCFCFTMTCELIWELLEWFGDNCLGQMSQGKPAVGYDVPLVTDTMQDILCNFIGGIVFCLHFLIGKLSRHSLGINFYEKELVFVRQQSQQTTLSLEYSGNLSNENIKIDSETEGNFTDKDTQNEEDIKSSESRKDNLI